MNQLYRQFILLLIGITGFLAAGAQIQVEITVKTIYSDYTADGGDDYGGRFRFYYNSPDDRCGPLLHPFCSNADRRCIQTPWQKFYNADVWVPLNTIYLPAGTTTFTLFMRTHHERQHDCTSRSSEECTVENLGCGDADAHQLTTSMGVNLASFPPGVQVPLGRMTNEDNTLAWADLLIRYTIPAPSQPVPQPNPSLTTFCANNILQLGTDVQPNNTGGLKYTWQCAIKSEDHEIWNPDKDPQNSYDPNTGECGHWEYDPMSPDGQYFVYASDCWLPDYITVHNWKNIPITNPSTDRFGSFTPQQAVFNDNITTQQDVYFRVMATSTEGKISGWSSSSIYTFLPPPPTITQNNINKKPSCVFPLNGKAEIPYNAINTPYSQVRWLLKNGWNNSNPCQIVFNPDGSITSNCGQIEKQSNGLVNVPKSASDAPIVIDNLPAGQYTLWVINPGESSGTCYSPINITIDQYPALTLTKQSATDLTCFQSNDGKFSLKADGGDPTSGYEFKLTAKNHPELNEAYAVITGNLYERTGLPADEYTIAMRNACTPEVTQVITLTEPVKTQGNAVFNQPSCYNPADGSVVVNVLQGMGSYTYQLFKDNIKTTEISATPNVKQVFGNLLPGKYQVKVLDAARLTCAGVDTTVVLIAPPPLLATLQHRDSVSCYGGSDGAILVKGDGGSGRYVFTLKSGGTTISTNNTGSFTDLPAGNYEVVLTKPADENCDDLFTLPVEVLQRSPLQASLTVTPVTCKGKDNGVVTATATGGSGSYSYYWEYWDGAAWKHNNFWFPTDVSISSLAPGRYRVTVSDNKSTASCIFTSQERSVIEPALLEITNVQTTDAACKADGGRIKITAAGGNGGYVYYYAVGSPNNFTAFTANTPLTVNGDYYIKVEDAKGCSVDGANAYPISLPSIPMDFTLQASDYEGTSVACYNGNNGIISIAATGGSGTGYQYALNSGAYQSAPEFKQLTAGIYSVTVQDLRGCIISKDIPLSQPQQPLLGAINNKKEVFCPGTPTGSFDIDIQYGRAPYQYSIDNGVTFQPSKAFTGLYTGTYNVVVKDKYDCRWTTAVTIVSTIPVVKYVNTIKNVSCFSGNDGSVLASPSGGQAPYQFNWLGKNNATSQLGTLAAGQYVLQVTDGAGCVSKDTVQIKQPAAPITAVTTTQPVCVGSNGSITMNASGGTPPYRYSSNNGATFQNDPVLANLPAATYSVVVKDANNCQAVYPVVINPANPMPDINFLVASGRYALDTLVIKEVSMPIPDSVHWRFDPAAQVIDNGASPQIRFNSAGNYWIDMTGYFKGCAYTIRKTVYLNPFDPEAGLVYTPPISVIDTVTLYPNPNTGQFSVHVKLGKKQKLIMLVQEMGSGREIIRRTYDPVLITDDYFALGNVSNGTFVLRVIAENDSRDIQFVISR
ncbi:MAG: SprB repeat-containing protein [Niastella sp.]|uniref:SprB repeat-containing protein n=1 Tax=Niastella sp. TaxID=1869183 RepID=UPI00389A6063